MKWMLKVPLFWILFDWIIVPIWLTYRIAMAVLGFWKCDHCKEWLWVNAKKRMHVSGPRSHNVTACNSCYAKLEKEYEERRKNMRPPMPPKGIAPPPKPLELRTERG